LQDFVAAVSLTIESTEKFADNFTSQGMPTNQSAAHNNKMYELQA